jgi:hypothetical protein
MSGVHRVSHQMIEAAVSEPGWQLARVGQVDELGVDADLGQREQRVEEHPARFAQVYPNLAVRLALFTVLEQLGAVCSPGHVTEAVGLDDVAELRVEHQPAREQLGLEVELRHRQTCRAEPRAHVLVRAALPDGHLIVHERVVHIAADRADRAHVERAVAEHPARGLGHERDRRGRVIDHARVVAVDKTVAEQRGAAR